MRGLQDIRLIKASRDAAEETLKSDSDLRRHPLLKEQLVSFEKKIHLE